MICGTLTAVAVAPFSALSLLGAFEAPCVSAGLLAFWPHGRCRPRRWTGTVFLLLDGVERKFVLVFGRPFWSEKALFSKEDAREPERRPTLPGPPVWSSDLVLRVFRAVVIIHGFP